MSVVFECASAWARELSEPDLPRLQALFEAHPEYFLAINGRGPSPTLAREDYVDVEYQGAVG